jgi:hypothetical protein
MKTDEGIYLTHVLNGTRSGRCHLIRPLHLHYLMTTWYLQYTSSGKRTFLNFLVNAKFKNVALPELTPICVWIAVMWFPAREAAPSAATPGCPQ